MLLGFKRQFAPFVEDGSKRHTIRGTRIIAPRAGETCHCYVDPRQKSMRLLGRWPCVRVDDISIKSLETIPGDRLVDLIDITINGTSLSCDEKELLAWNDGFRGSERRLAFIHMMGFWTGRLPFVGTLIHWDFGKPVARGR